MGTFHRAFLQAHATQNPPFLCYNSFIMTTKEISLCKNFHCLGPACPRNCCRGWHIPVDDATVDRYKSLPGTEGRSVRSFLTRRRGLIVFRRIFGTCPFLNSDRLCQFQANGAPELMPLVCRYYPREIITYSDYTEITLSLSCISAARLFVERPERNAWADAPGAEPFWDVANDDADFLAFLLKDREKIQDYIWREDLSLEQIWAGLYAYIVQEHAAIMRDRLEDLAEIELEDGREESGSEKTAAAGTYEAGPAGDDGEGGRVGPAPNLAFFPITVLDRMILNHIDYGMLLLREPKFASLIMKYNKLFKGLFVDTADEEFSDAVKRMMERNPGFAKKYRAYFSYNIDQLYLKAYENYFVLRQFLFAILYTELYMLFELVAYETDGTDGILSTERQAEILCLTETCVRHNPDLTQNLYNVIRQDFL